MSEDRKKIGIVLRCISHELANWLSPALMLAEALGEELEGEGALDAKDLKQALEAASDIVGIIREMSLAVTSSTDSEDEPSDVLNASLTIANRFPQSEAAISLRQKLVAALECYERERDQEHASFSSP